MLVTKAKPLICEISAKASSKRSLTLQVDLMEKKTQHVKLQKSGRIKVETSQT